MLIYCFRLRAFAPYDIFLPRYAMALVATYALKARRYDAVCCQRFAIYAAAELLTIYVLRRQSPCERARLAPLDSGY